MTVTFKSETINPYTLYIEQEKYSNVFKVGICKSVGIDLYGYPISELTYPSYEKAKRRYSYLKTKAKRGEL